MSKKLTNQNSYEFSINPSWKICYWACYWPYFLGS